MLKRIDWRNIGRNWLGHTARAPQGRRRKAPRDQRAANIVQMAPESLESRALLTLTVNLAAMTIAEDAGAAATTATVTRDGDLAAPLTVSLTSNDPSEATVQTSVVIEAGQATSPAFDINAIDDLLVDGNQTVVITANETSHGNGIAFLTVTDNDIAELTVTIGAGSISESAGATAATGTVTRNTPTTSDLIVTLASDDPSEASVPATVTILANQTSATFDINAVDDALLDGTQTATITATAATFTDGSDTIDVTDSETLTIAISAASIAENGGPAATTATVTRSNTDNAAALVVTLNSSATDEATVPATVTIPGGSASVTFDINAIDDTLLDGTQTVTISGTAAGYVAGSDTVDVTDVETLTVVIAAAAVAENGGTAATTATVTRSNTDITGPLTVTLTSDDLSEATVPAMVTILAGQTSATFNIAAVDDTLIDGTQTAAITAAATGYMAGSDTLDVTDVETLSVAIVAASVAENGGAAATTATVTRGNTDISGPLTVSLASDDTSEATVVATVTILAGETSATFDINAIDDSLLDGTQTATITAAATGYVAGSDTVDVTDQESLTLTISTSAIAENAGTTATTGTITRSNTDTASALVVTLTSDDIGEATVPLEVTIPIGQTSATFDISAVDDDLLDGTQAVLITAATTGYATVSETLNVNDYETLTIFLNPDSINENGGTSTATVTRSNSDTTFELIVTLNSDDTSAATVPLTVTIPAGLASTTFDVDAVDDTVLDGTQIANISGTATGYVAVSAPLSVTDYEPLSLVILGGSIGESGGATTATISRSSADVAEDLVVTLSSSDLSEATVRATIIIIAGQVTSAPFAIGAVDDAIADGDQTVTITATGAGYAAATDTVIVTDDEGSEALTVTVAPMSISELGGTAIATVHRNSVATDALTVMLANDDPSEIDIPTFVVIPAGQASVTFTITAVDDAIVDGTQTATITATATGHDSGSDDIEVTDDEVATLTLVIMDAAIDENGGVTTAVVTRNSDTSGPLVVTLQTSDASEAVPHQTTITIPAGVTESAPFFIDAVNDVLADGLQTATITASATSHTNGSDTVDVTDDEGGAALSVSISEVTISENGGTATATVTRNTEPLADLTVNLTSNDLGEATVPTSVVIPTGQNSVSFQITGVDDSLADGTQTVTITGTAAGFADGTDTIDVSDDEGVAGVSVSIADASISENGGTTTGTVTRNTLTTNDLTVTLTTDDSGEATVPASVVILAGQTSATFTITAVDDALVDGSQTVVITAAATGLASGTGSVQVTDDEAATLTLSTTDASISENGGVTMATVTRNSDTTDALTVTVTSGDSSEATVPTTIVILAGATDSVPFAITAVNDTDVDGTQTVNITVTAANHADGVDTVDVTDDDVAPTFSVISPQGIITDLRPQISWTAVDDAVSYDVYLNLDGAGTTVFRQLNVDSGTTTITPDVDLEFARYRVFVYANFASEPRLTATPHTFIVSASPQKLTPTSSLDSNTPEFSWNRLAGATSYTLYVNVPGSPVTFTVNDATPTATSPLTFTPTNALPSGDYKWWIRGIRENGWQGSWSTPTTFSTGGRSKVTSITPGQTVTSSTPQLIWSTVPDATSYEIYVSREGTPGALFRDAGIAANTYPSRVLENGNYTVWVRTTRSNGTAVWGSGVPFTVNATTTGLQTIPTTPTGPGFNTTPEFVWEATTGATSYDIYLHNGVTSELQTGLTGTTFTPTAPLAAGPWTWSIRPVDGAGVGAWSTSVAFNTSGRSTLLTPATPTTTTPTFTWQPVTDAVRYILQVDNVTTGTSRVIREDNLTATTFTATTPLVAGDYRVWVRAISNSTDGAWSQPLNFTVEVTQQLQSESPTTLLASVRQQLSSVEAVEPEVALVPSVPQQQGDVVEQTAEVSEPLNADDLMIAMLSSGQWLEG